MVFMDNLIGNLWLHSLTKSLVIMWFNFQSRQNERLYLASSLMIFVIVISHILLVFGMIRPCLLCDYLISACPDVPGYTTIPGQVQSGCTEWEGASETPLTGAGKCNEKGNCKAFGVGMYGSAQANKRCLVNSNTFTSSLSPAAHFCTYIKIGGFRV